MTDVEETPMETTEQDPIEEGEAGTLRWTTAHGDRVKVWQAAPLGRPMDWRWHVRARNGEIVGQGEGHPRRRTARIAAMRHHPPMPAGDLGPLVEYHVVFDGPPGPESGRFVELEDADGRGLSAGRWEHRGQYWHLVIPVVTATPPAPTEPPAALVERLVDLLGNDDTVDTPPARIREVAEAWAQDLAPLLTVAPPLPADQVETTWPAAWFSYVDDSPDVGAEVLVDGTPYRVAARYPDGVPDRIRVRLTRAEVRRA